MSRRSKYFLILFVLFGVSVLSAFLFLPRAIESKASSAIQKLERKGVHISYGALENHVDKIEFHDLSLHTKKGGMNIECDFKTLIADIDVFKSLLGTPRLDQLTLQEGKCELRKLKKTDTDDAKNQKPNSTAAELSKIDATFIPDLDFENIVFRYGHNSLRIRTLQSEGSVLNGSLLVRALSEKYAVKIEGSLKPEMQVLLSPEESDVFHANVLGNVFEFAAVEVNTNLQQKSARVGISNFRAERDGILVNLKAFYLDVEPTHRKFTAKGLELIADFEKVNNLIRGRKKSTSGIALDAPAEPLVSPLSLLSKIDIELKDASFIARIKTDAPAKFNDIYLAEHANGTLQRGALNAQGELGDGSFEVRALFNAAEKRIETFELEFERIRLSAIPGMPSGRSLLPNRGTSGKLDGNVSGNVALRAPWFSAIDQPLRFASHFRWDDGVLDLDGLSTEPIHNISFASSVFGSLNFATKTLALRGRVSSNQVPFRVDAKLSGWPENIELDLSLKGDQVSCETYSKTIPPSLWGPLKKAEFAENAQLEVVFHVPFSRPKDTHFDLRGYEKCKITKLHNAQSLTIQFRGSETDLKDVFWLKKAFIKRIKEVDGNAKILVGPGTRNYVSLDKMPKWVGGAAYLSEQMNFYRGKPISIPLIRRALKMNLEGGRFVYGGSTVTQQLVKNLFLSRDKTISRKLQEMLIAWRINQVLSKDRILELYLNVIEFGPNVYGIQAASQHYFQKSATALTPAEAVFLAMLKPAPWRGTWYVDRGATPSNPYFLERTEILLQRLLDEEMIDEEMFQEEMRVHLTWENGTYIRTLEDLPEPESENEETPGASEKTASETQEKSPPSE